MPETTNDPDNDFALFSSEVVNLGSPDSMLDKKHGGTGESHPHERKNPEKGYLDKDLTAEEYAHQDVRAKGQRAERLYENERDKQPMYWKLMYDATFRSLSAHETKLLHESGLPVPEAIFEIQDRLKALDDVLETRKNEVLSVIQDKKAEIDALPLGEKLKIAVAIESTSFIQSFFEITKEGNTVAGTSAEEGPEKAKNLLASIGVTLDEFYAFYKKYSSEYKVTDPLPSLDRQAGGFAKRIEALAELSEKEIDAIIDNHFSVLLEKKSVDLSVVNNRLKRHEERQFEVLSHQMQAILTRHAGRQYKGAPYRYAVSINDNQYNQLIPPEIAALRSQSADEAAGLYVDISYDSWVPSKMEFRGHEIDDVLLELSAEMNLSLAHTQTADGIARRYSRGWYTRCADSYSVHDSRYYSGDKRGSYVTSERQYEVGTGFYYEYGLGKSAEDAATGGARFKPSTTSRSPMRLNPVRG